MESASAEAHKFRLYLFVLFGFIVLSVPFFDVACKAGRQTQVLSCTAFDCRRKKITQKNKKRNNFVTIGKCYMGSVEKTEVRMYGIRGKNRKREQKNRQLKNCRFRIYYKLFILYVF